MVVKAEKYQRFEIIALFFTAILKFILMDRLGMKAFYISGICIFWFSYICLRYSSDKSVLNSWGFKQENFRISASLLLPIIFLSAVLSIIYRFYTDDLVFNWHILPLLVLYPLWGVFQQFFMLGLISRNLKGLNRFMIMLLTSSLFSLIHYPSVSLMIFTFLLELIFVQVYLKWRNLWAIGIAHGWIASFLLYYVLGRDLWLELFVWFR